MESSDGLAWVFRDGKLRREIPPPPPPEILPAVVGAGPGLDTGVPLPDVPREWERKERCYCGSDDLNAREFPEVVRVLYGPPLPHAAHCPKFGTESGTKGGAYADRSGENPDVPPCCRSGEAHFHDKHILFENGKELF